MSRSFVGNGIDPVSEVLRLDPSQSRHVYPAPGPRPGPDWSSRT